MNDSAEVTWLPATADHGHGLGTLYAWTHAEVPILNVKLSPSADIAAVQRVLPQEKFENSSVGFFNTGSWSRLWVNKVPLPPGCNVTHPVEVLFLSEERYVLSDIEIAMYERGHHIWNASIPLPPWPSSRPYQEPRDWEIVRSWAPALDGQSLFVPVHWARNLEPARWDGATWQDRYAVEVISITDGSWIRRLDDGEPPPTPSSVLIEIEDGLARCVESNRTLATLLPPTGRRITAADISLRARRAVVVLDARELRYLVLPSKIA